MIAIENKDGIFNTVTLEKIKDISEALEEMEQFSPNDITSLYAADNITGSEYGLEVKSFSARFRNMPTSLRP